MTALLLPFAFWLIGFGTGWNLRRGTKSILSVPASSESLFSLGYFKLHDGEVSRWKIECDALTAADWQALADMAAPNIGSFKVVEAVPGVNAEKFAAALREYVLSDESDANPLLIVDDVVTTGGSMEQQRAGREAVGVVAFARGSAPSWVVPLFSWVHASERVQGCLECVKRAEIDRANAEYCKDMCICFGFGIKDPDCPEHGSGIKQQAGEDESPISLDAPGCRRPTGHGPSGTPSTGDSSVPASPGSAAKASATSPAVSPSPPPGGLREAAQRALRRITVAQRDLNNLWKVVMRDEMPRTSLDAAEIDYVAMATLSAQDMLCLTRGELEAALASSPEEKV